jgi:hypothetical protein
MNPVNLYIIACFFLASVDDLIIQLTLSRELMLEPEHMPEMRKVRRTDPAEGSETEITTYLVIIVSRSVSPHTRKRAE